MVPFRRALLALGLFGMSFGYVEAAVVVYLRTIYDPIRVRIYPQHPPGELFPLLRPEHLADTNLLGIELGREFATLIMLAAAAIAVSRNGRQWMAAFLVAFGFWDIFFYIFLKVTIGWPASLFTWDILFLLPGPWVGPVIAPVLVSIAMIGGGIATLLREASGNPVRLSARHWTLLVLSGLVIITAFMWDFRSTMAGNWPNPFNWPVFAAGLLLGLATFVQAFRLRPAPAARPSEISR